MLYFPTIEIQGLESNQVKVKTGLELSGQKLTSDPVYQEYDKIRRLIIDLNWKELEKFDKILAQAVRIIADYHYRESLARNSEQLQKLFDEIKKAGEQVAYAQVGVGVIKGFLSGLVSAKLLALGTASFIGGIIAGIVLIGSLIYQPAKAISKSKERMDDLGRRIDKLRYSRGVFSENIYWKGLELLHSRPKCRALTSDCAKEHLFKSAEVDLFNIFTDFLVQFYDAFTFEKFREQYNLQQMKQETQIAEAIVFSEVKKNEFDWKFLVAVALFVLAGYLGFRK